MLKLAREQGYRLALGDVFPLDSGISSPRFQRWYILQHAQPGSIIILHDALSRGVRTAAALRAVLPILKDRGFKIVTLTALATLAEEAYGSPELTNSKASSNSAYFTVTMEISERLMLRSQCDPPRLKLLIKRQRSMGWTCGWQTQVTNTRGIDGR